MSARLVVGSVTTSESLVLYVFFSSFLPYINIPGQTGSQSEYALPLTEDFTETSGSANMVSGKALATTTYGSREEFIEGQRGQQLTKMDIISIDAATCDTAVVR